MPGRLEGRSPPALACACRRGRALPHGRWTGAGLSAQRACAPAQPRARNRPRAERSARAPAPPKSPRRGARAADARGGAGRGRRGALTQRPRPSGVQNRSLGLGRVREEGESPPLAAAAASPSVTPSVCPVHVVAAASSARTPGASPAPPGAAAAPRGDGRRPRPALPLPSSPSVRPSVHPPARASVLLSSRQPSLGPVSPLRPLFLSPARCLFVSALALLYSPSLAPRSRVPLNALLSTLRASLSERPHSSGIPPERPHIFGGFQDTLYTPGTPLRASHISFGGLPFHLHPQFLGSCFLLDLISSGFFLFWCPPPYPGTSQDPLGSPSLGPPKAPQLPDFSAPPCLPLVCPSSLSPCSLSGLWVGVPCFALPSCLSHICLGGLTTHRLLR